MEGDERKTTAAAEVWLGAKCMPQKDGFTCVQSTEVKTGGGACAEELRDFLLCTIKWGVGSGCADQLKDLTDCLNPTSQKETKPSPTF